MFFFLDTHTRILLFIIWISTGSYVLPPQILLAVSLLLLLLLHSIPNTQHTQRQIYYSNTSKIESFQTKQNKKKNACVYACVYPRSVFLFCFVFWMLFDYVFFLFLVFYEYLFCWIQQQNKQQLNKTTEYPLCFLNILISCDSKSTRDLHRYSQKTVPIFFVLFCLMDTFVWNDQHKISTTTTTTIIIGN